MTRHNRWFEITFYFGSWLECECGFQARSDEDRLRHDDEVAEQENTE